MSLPLRFGPHQLEAILASGQSGLLLQAREFDGAGRSVVVKIPYVYLQRAPGFRQAFLERLQPFSERQCPGLVRVLSTGKTHGLAWVSTEYAAGTDMATLLLQMQAAGRRPTPRQVLTVGLRLGNILSALHAAPGRNGPMVHAELRPSKILFTPDGGISLLPPGAITTAAAERGPSGSAARFAWRAPEQLMRVPESIRTDVRGIALLLLVLATGSNPFQRRTTARTLSAILQDQVMLEGDSELTPELSGLLRGAMASDPDRRPRDVPSFLEALKQELARIGGEAKAWEWRSFVEAVRQASPPPPSPDDAKLVAERDALLARLARDARRAEAQEEVATAAAPTADAPKLGEPSGFTLVPEDHEPITAEIEPDTAPIAAAQARALLDPSAQEESTEDEDTAEAARSSERAPMPKHAEAVFAAPGVVDSSFVLVEDNARRVDSARPMVGSAGRPAVHDSLVMAPRADDDDSIPTLDVEEGQSLISTGRPALEETAETEEVRPADPDDEPASVRVPTNGQPLAVATPPAVPPPHVQPAHPIEPITLPPPTRTTGPVTPPKVEPRRTDPPRPPDIRPSQRPGETSGSGRWLVGLALLSAVAVGGYLATREPDPLVPAKAPLADAGKAPVLVDPVPPVLPTIAVGEASPPVAVVEPVAEPDPVPVVTPPVTPHTGPGVKDPKPGERTKVTVGGEKPPKPTEVAVVEAGPPSVQELKPQITDNKVTIVVKGSGLGRPDQELVERSGDGNQYIFRLSGVESKLGWTRQQVSSDLVSGIEVLTSPEGTQIRVNTGTVPYNVNYVPTADGFKFAVIRKTVAPN